MDFNSIYKLFFSLTFIFEYANLFRCSNQKETRIKKMRRSHRIVETGIARISCWKISRCHPSVQFYTRKRSSQLEQLRAVYFTNTGHARGSIFLWMLPRSNYLVPRVSVCLSSPPLSPPPRNYGWSNEIRIRSCSISWLYANSTIYQDFDIKLIFLERKFSWKN